MLFEMVIFGFFLGTILGSFAKALADRSLKKISFLGRSFCTHCHHKLNWNDLIPIVSFLVLRGKCRYCHKKIGKEYLIVEVITGILVALVFYQAFQNFQFSILNYPLTLAQFVFDTAFKVFAITILMIVTLTDLKETLILDIITIPAIIIAAVSLLLDTFFKIFTLYNGLQSTGPGLYLFHQTDYFQRHMTYFFQDYLGALITGFVIGGFFLALIIMTKGKGMGGGDVKLGVFIGLILGFPMGFLAIMLAFVSGAIVAIGLIIIGKKRFGENIPFGPFLVLGTLLALFWGQQIISNYLTYLKI